MLAEGRSADLSARSSEIFFHNHVFLAMRKRSRSIKMPFWERKELGCCGVSMVGTQLHATRTRNRCHDQA